MEAQYKLNGKFVNKEAIGSDAKLVQTVNELHYETPEYTEKQNANAMKYFQHLSEQREELEKYHG